MPVPPSMICLRSKAFDCVSHALLLVKLRNFGFDPASIQFFESYLTNRYQYTVYNHDASLKSPVRFGVPQGSVLGPILFLIFINDLSTAIPEHSRLVLFADDTTTVDVSESLADLDRRVSGSERSIFDWFACNGLVVNDSKTQMLTFSLRHMEEQCQPVKYLGVYVDNKLTWEEHSSRVSSRLSTIVFAMRNLKNIVSRECLLRVYYGYFYPHLTYALLVWGHSSHSSLVFAVQRRCVRVLAGLRYDECCRSKFIQLQILTFPSIYIFSCLLYVKGNITSYTRHDDKHAYSTRHSDNLLADFKRTQRARDGINFYSIKFYKLPNKIRALPPTSFKQKIKSFLLSKAYYHWDQFLFDNLDSIS